MRFRSKQLISAGTRAFVALLLASASSWTYAAIDFMTDPSTPECAAGAFLWEQEVDVTNLDAEGLPILEVRLVRNTEESFTIPGPYPPEFDSSVTVSVDDTVAWDGYVGRMNTSEQPNERYRIVFLKDGVIQGGTGWTGEDETDDGINTGWESDEWRGPLDQGIVLENGADEIRIVHWSDDEFGTGDRSSPNSVVPVSLCISSEPPPPPEIEICTLVTLNPDMVSDFSDADNIAGDSCDAFPQGIPVGVVGAVDGTYRLKVTNTGPEKVINVQINAPDFGLVNAPIPCNGGMLDTGEMCTIDFDDPGFPSLKVADVCVAPGAVNKIATVDGEGESSGIPVSDDDPAIVDCVAEPDIDLRKQVSLDGGPFLDADTEATGPSGVIGDDAEYRLIVENTGTETLVGARVTDLTLGLLDVPVPGGPLAPGEIRPITQGDAGFGPLLFIDRCDNAGTFLNIARVDAEGETSGTAVEAEDPAYVSCEEPMIELLKQVSLDGINFFDADLPGDPDVPVGIVGFTDATYRFIVRNTGTETLANVLIEDPTLGISAFIADLLSGESRVIEQGDAGFGNLYQPMRCGGTPGNKSNIASVTAVGESSGEPVSDDDPANVRCIVGPEIVLLKQVSLDGVNFVDADTPADAPVGLLGADATYRLIVRNVGDEDLTNVRINDSTLGIVDAPVPDLPIGGEVVIDAGSFGGFEELFVPNRCDSVGDKLNIARADAIGATSGASATDDDPAWVTCEPEPPALACRVTAGLNDVFAGNRYTAGGQAGASTALQPQPSGEWTHTQHSGPAGRFTFHGGTASAPEGTEIDAIRCSDPGGCRPSGNPPSPVKQIDFEGIGTFKNIGPNSTPDFVAAGATVTAEGKGNQAFDGTFHWFEVNMDDLGEPGNTNPMKNPDDVDPAMCPVLGFGEKADVPLANCGCSDFYRITIYDGVNAADVIKNADGSIDKAQMNTTDVIYEVWGYIDGGNLQIHSLTGKDLKSL